MLVTLFDKCIPCLKKMPHSLVNVFMYVWVKISTGSLVLCFSFTDCFDYSMLQMPLTHWCLGDVTVNWNFSKFTPWISAVEILCISYGSGFRWMPQYLTVDGSTLVQVMACCLMATSHHLNQCWQSSTMLYDITRPQRVNGIKLGRDFFV